MKKQIRIAVTFLLMLCISISALLYLFFDIAQFHYKVAASQRAEVGARLQVIKLSLQEFNNVKEDELWHNGALYDVYSYVIVNGSVFVSVLHDDGEEQLVKTITESFEPNDRYSSDGFAHICKYRFHAFDGGKILTASYRVPHVRLIYRSPFLLSRFVPYIAASCIDVIKPPPRRSASYLC